MTTAEDVKTPPHIVHFRCPPKLLAALQKAADKQFTSISDVARASIAQAMSHLLSLSGVKRT
jgi:hypothetical protein